MEWEAFKQQSFVSHRVEEGWLELFGVSWMTCAGTKSLIVLESEDLIVPTYSATRLIYFHNEMSSLRQIAALPCFFYNLFWSNALHRRATKHLQLPPSMANLLLGTAQNDTAVSKMTLQSGAQPAFCRAESKAIQSCYMRAEYQLCDQLDPRRSKLSKFSSFGVN